MTGAREAYRRPVAMLRQAEHIAGDELDHAVDALAVGAALFGVDEAGVPPVAPRPVSLRRSWYTTSAGTGGLEERVPLVTVKGLVSREIVGHLAEVYRMVPMRATRRRRRRPRAGGRRPSPWRAPPRSHPCVQGPVATPAIAHRDCPSVSLRQLEVPGQRSGVIGPRGTRAGRGREPAEKIIRQRLIRGSSGRAERAGGGGGVGAELGEDPPVLEVGEAVLGRCTSDGEDSVGFLLAGCELVGAAGGVAGDDHGVEDVVVQATESEVRQRPEAGGAQVGQDVVVAGGGVVVGAAGPGGGYPDQTALLVGQREEVQAMAAVLAGVVPPVSLAGAASSADECRRSRPPPLPALRPF